MNQPLALPRNNDELQVLKMLAAGRPTSFIAQALNLPEADVTRIRVDLADDDPQRAAAVVAAYEAGRLGEELPPGEPRPNRPATLPPRRLVTVPGAKRAGLDELLDQAEASAHARTRTRAARVRELLRELVQSVAAETADREAHAQATAQRRQLEQRVEALQRQLAQTRQELRDLHRPSAGCTIPAEPRPLALKAGGPVEPRTVRAWARDHGVECSPRGRVPQHVVDAWRAATEGVAA